jgi:hypothetical protein
VQSALVLAANQHEQILKKVTISESDYRML